MRTQAAIVGVALAAGVLWVTRGVGLFGAHPGSGAEGGGVELEELSYFDQAVNMTANTVTNPTSMSAAGLDMLKGFEGFSATPYYDFHGYSIGFGHLIKAGESLSSVTPDQAHELLAADVGWAERAVSAAVGVALSQEQFDALVSLAFNIGESAFKRSTLVRLLNAGDYAGAAAEFDRWNRAGGQVHAGLVRRRAQERALFQGGVAV